MKYIVLLVQRGVSAQTHAVSGKIGKNYGNAVASPKDGGVALQMTLEDYQRDAHDIIGNTAPGQQWVPIFVPEVGTTASHGKCDRCPAEATQIWDRFLYCDAHAPGNATRLEGAPPPALAPAPPQPPPPAEDVRQPVHENVPGAGGVVEPQGDLPPEQLAPPVMGTERENDAEVASEIPPQMRAPKPEAQPSPGPEAQSAPVTPAQPTPQPPIEEVKTKAPDAPTPAQTVIASITEGVLKALLPRIEAIEQRLNGSGKRQKKQQAPNRTASEFQQLRARARALKINTFQMGKEQIRKAITEAEKG